MKGCVYKQPLSSSLLYMLKSDMSCVLFVIVLSTSLLYLSMPVYGQSQSATTSATKAGDSVSVSASVTVQVTNESLKTKDGMLRSSVISFLNSGPNVLKTVATDQPIVKTKIVNQINNVTQSVQGLDATNAIIGIEVSKALKTIVSSTDKSNQAGRLLFKRLQLVNQ